MKFPRVAGTVADGTRVALPEGFPGSPTLVLVTFGWQQRSLVAPWRKFAERLAERYEPFEFRELAVAGQRRGMLPPDVGGFGPPIATGRRSDRTISVGVNKRAFRRSLGLVGEQTNYALLVDDGYVVRRAAGILTRETAEGLTSLLDDWVRANAIANEWTTAGAEGTAEGVPEEQG